MAKKKKKLPKKVGGFNVPKSVRRSSFLRAMLVTPTGRDMIAQAITAAAGAAVAVLVQEREAIAETGAEVVKTGARKSKHAAGIANEMVQSAASAVMGVVADAVKNFTPKAAKAKKPSRQVTAH